ncbi:hypothetical protein C5S32_09535 [ANME-1 cluster archaeon GoMg1]|nr:hypothetical protein [ANME-1 cluster archaeon GoMg1]
MKEENLSVREYLYSIRFYVLLVSVVFVGAIIIGYIGFLSEIFNVPLEWIQQLSENLKESTQVYPTWIIFLAFFAVLFLNNSFTCFLDIILGPLIGIFPLFSAFINGGLLGWFAKEQGLVIFLAIVPHGMFEIPAFLLSAAIGLRLGREVLKRKGDRDLKKELRNGLRVFLILILPLLLIAALIESALIVITLFF